jgi:hypothetical protein
VIALGEIFYSCDTAMIRYVYPYVKKYLDLWQLGEDGLVQHRAGGWGIGLKVMAEVVTTMDGQADH